jgi:secondary thiamine-phosphate synthase enzyme
MISRIQVPVDHQGLYDISRAVADRVADRVADAGEAEGLCTLFIRHTSASLLIQENYDPSARVDLEHWLNKLVPENDPDYTHTLEGADDMPAHIKAALTATSLSIPFMEGRLMLGTWQGIFLWEHRHRPGSREIVIHMTE